jgi:mRNA-degrading endonuclease toxin of MazEF toxin-antitoxin module
LSLTTPERETVITFSDEGETATIQTHQRPIITKLNKNPLATKVEDISFAGTAGAVFELPADRISFLSSYRTGAATSAQIKNLAKARLVRELAPVSTESSTEAA